MFLAKLCHFRKMFLNKLCLFRKMFRAVTHEIHLVVY